MPPPSSSTNGRAGWLNEYICDCGDGCELILHQPGENFEVIVRHLHMTAFDIEDVVLRAAAVRFGDLRWRDVELTADMSEGFGAGSIVHGGSFRCGNVHETADANFNTPSAANAF